jgi:hypothetical protein
MRSQTTLEFVILLSAIAAFGSFAISVYAGLLRQQHTAYFSLLNGSMNTTALVNASSSTGSEPFLYASMANILYVNRSNSLQVVVALPESATLLSLKATGSQQYGIAPSAYYNISASGMEILPFSVVPTVQGPVNVGISADIAYGNSTIARNLTVESFAISQGANLTALVNGELSTSIDRHNEYVFYSISNATPVYTAEMWSFCSRVNMYYQQRPIQFQCGNANWYFFEFDPYCYWDNGGLPRTYCVELTPTNTSVRQMQSQQSYAYNITVTLFNRSTALYSDINSTAAVFPVLGADGKDYGDASVEGVSGTGTQAYSNYMVLNTTESRWQTNMSDYSAYQQALNNLVSVMDYYNNTGGDVDSISEAISALNSTALRLIASNLAVNTNDCDIIVQGPKWYYSCKPFSLLYYNIDARLNMSRVVHQLLAVQGSTVNVT